MRQIRLFLACFMFTLYSFSQTSSKEEYDIYASIIGNNGYQFYPINFNTPVKYSFPINDTIYNEIKKIPNKEFDLKKLFAESLKYSIGKTFKVSTNSLNQEIYFSPIYFKNEFEAFLIVIVSDNTSKPLYSFLQAEKINGIWSFIDCYERY